MAGSADRHSSIPGGPYLLAGSSSVRGTAPRQCLPPPDACMSVALFLSLLGSVLLPLLPRPTDRAPVWLRFCHCPGPKSSRSFQSESCGVQAAAGLDTGQGVGRDLVLSAECGSLTGPLGTSLLVPFPQLACMCTNDSQRCGKEQLTKDRRAHSHMECDRNNT